MSRNEYYSEEQYEQDQYDEVEETEQDWVDELEEDDDAENDVKYAYRMIELLRKKLENAKPVPLSNNRMINAEECINMLDDLQDCMPAAMKRAAYICSQKDNMLRDAEDKSRRHMASREIQFQQRQDKHEQQMEKEAQASKARAKRIIEEAEEKAKAMVRSGVIASRVEEEVRALRSNAQAQAQEILLRTEDECYKKLDMMSVSMGKMLKEINRLRAQFEEE